MPFNDFTIGKIQEDFGLEFIEDQDLFSQIKEIEISSILIEELEFKVPIALAINTEKARSELIISDILIEVKRILKNRISLFSGINFDVDREKNLTGYCDFIISKSPEQFFLKSPIITIVEAKNEKIPLGIGQCIAEMIGAKLFNEKSSNPIKTIYGAVTTGNIWKFLKYEDKNIYVDKKEYHINFPGKIVGILVEMANENV